MFAASFFWYFLFGEPWLAILLGWIYWWKILSLLYLRTSISLLFLKDIFSWWQNTGLTVLFFLHLKNILPFPLGSTVSNESTVNLFPITTCDFSHVSRFFPFLVFRSLIIMCLGMDFFGFTIFRVYSAFWMYKLMPFVNFAIFSANISSTFLAPHSSSLLLLGLQGQTC